MESIQAQWCATRPRSPSISVLAQGSPFVQASLRRGGGLGDRGLEGRRKMARRVKAQSKPPPTRPPALTPSSPALNSELTGEMRRALAGRQVGNNTLWGRRELGFPACLPPRRGRGRNKCRCFLCKWITESVLTSTYPISEDQYVP